MILVDTSVWIDHLRASDAELIALLNRSQVLMHPFVLGELACGNLRNRTEVLALLKDLPQAQSPPTEKSCSSLSSTHSWVAALVMSMPTCWRQ